jgi:hypothetical protein
MSTQTINEKYISWLEKGKAGDKRFMIVTKTSNNLWYLVSNNRAEPITTLKIAADHGNGMLPIYQYEAGKPDIGEFKSIIIIKNENKMMIGNTTEISAYGITEATASARVILIYLKTSNIHNIIFAHEKSHKINMVFDASENDDALWHCMTDMFSLPKSVEEEVHAHEL